MLTLTLKSIERCVTKTEQNRLFIGRLPRLPLVIRELECISARLDRNLRCHMDERLSDVSSEIGNNLGEIAVLKSHVDEIKSSLSSIKRKVSSF